METIAIGGFVRSDLDGKWYDANGIAATEQQQAALHKLASERTARPVRARCTDHSAYEADNCPSCGTARGLGQ